MRGELRPRWRRSPAWRRRSAAVEAETCSAEAEDCSATAATSVTSPSARARAGADLLDRGGDLGDPLRRRPRRRRRSRTKASRVCSTVATPSSVRCRALGDDADDARASGPASRRSAPAISEAARPDSSASLRTSSATTAKPRPCSPARAASIAAFSASRFVCSASPVIVVDDAADPLGARGEVLDRRRRPGRTRRRPRGSRSVAVAGGGDALAGDARAPPRRPRRWRARPAALAPARAVLASCTASRVDSTIRTWRSAPWATSVTAPAISPTARPASSEEAGDLLRAGGDGAGAARDLADQRRRARCTSRCRRRRCAAALSSIALKVLRELPELVGRCGRRAASWLSAAERVKSPAAAASRPSVSSLRQCSSRLRRRAISARTGPDDAARDHDRERGRDAAARRPSTISSSATSATRASASTPSTVALRRRRDRVLQLARSLAKSLSIAGETLPGVERRASRSGPRRRLTVSARERVSASSSAWPQVGRLLGEASPCSALPATSARELARPRPCGVGARRLDLGRDLGPGSSGRRHRRRGARRRGGRSTGRSGRPRRRARPRARHAPRARRPASLERAEGVEGESAVTSSSAIGLQAEGGGQANGEGQVGEARHERSPGRRRYPASSAERVDAS